MKYLLIFEDGALRQVNDWDDTWPESVEAGVLTVVRYQDGEYQDYNGEDWMRV